MELNKAKTLSFIWSVSTWFKRGYSSWLTFAINFVSVDLIIYRLLIQTVPALEDIFPSLIIFTIVFLVTFIPATAIVGYFDYTKGSARTESNITIEASPYFRDVAKALNYLCDGNTVKAKEVLARWVTQADE